LITTLPGKKAIVTNNKEFLPGCIYIVTVLRDRKLGRYIYSHGIKIKPLLCGHVLKWRPLQ